MSFSVSFKLNDRMYLKDPQETDVGRRILKNSIVLIDKLGFEGFTFRKLAKQIKTTEASVYRYFENKHVLLIYLVSWYWEWVHYLIEISTINITSPAEKLRIAIDNILNASYENQHIEYINESILQRIVIAEGSKAYHTKDVDEENRVQMFNSYKTLVMFLSAIILELKPDFQYPRSLASNLFEMANNQIYFAQHLPGLTDIKDKDSQHTELKSLLEFYAFKLLDIKA